MATDIQVIDLGLTDYRQTWELQRERRAQVQAGAPEVIYITEHKPVYTLGRRGHEENLLRLPAGTECIRIERGGDITYHAPGQLVVYPIINLHLHHLGVKDYVSALEEAVISTCGDYGIEAGRVEGATGVWLGIGTNRERKICAMGFAVSRGVTMHGLALNVSLDLSGFQAINPCGFTDKAVTSIAQETGQTPQMPEVKTRLVSHLKAML